MAAMIGDEKLGNGSWNGNDETRKTMVQEQSPRGKSLVERNSAGTANVEAARLILVLVPADHRTHSYQDRDQHRKETEVGFLDVQLFQPYSSKTKHEQQER